MRSKCVRLNVERYVDLEAAIDEGGDSEEFSEDESDTGSSCLAFPLILMNHYIYPGIIAKENLDNESQSTYLYRWDDFDREEQTAEILQDLVRNIERRHRTTTLQPLDFEDDALRSNAFDDVLIWHVPVKVTIVSIDLTINLLIYWRLAANAT